MVTLFYKTRFPLLICVDLKPRSLRKDKISGTYINMSLCTIDGGSIHVVDTAKVMQKHVTLIKMQISQRTYYDLDFHTQVQPVH